MRMIARAAYRVAKPLDRRPNFHGDGGMRVLTQRSVLSAVRAQALPKTGRYPAAARCRTQRRGVMNEAPAAAEYESNNDDSTTEAANLHGGRMPARRQRRTAIANPMQMLLLLRVASVRGVRPP